MYILIALLFAAIGLAMLLFPEKIYHLTESWKSDVQGEPSRLFLFSTRFGGVMVILVTTAVFAVEILE